MMVESEVREGNIMSETEWQRMHRGEVYNDFDKDLFDRRVRAKKFFKAYNRTEDDETDERERLMKELFLSVGKNVWIEPDFHCEFGNNITIGDNVYINFGCVILDCALVTIGENTLIGPDVGIYAANHALDSEERIHGGCIGKEIHIGRNVWIGGGVRIVPGVTIHDNSVIGTGSVVTHDIPEGVVAVGNPCRVLRKISKEDKTGYLER